MNVCLFGLISILILPAHHWKYWVRGERGTPGKSAPAGNEWIDLHSLPAVHLSQEHRVIHGNCTCALEQYHSNCESVHSGWININDITNILLCVCVWVCMWSHSTHIKKNCCFLNIKLVQEIKHTNTCKTMKISLSSLGAFDKLFAMNS